MTSNRWLMLGALFLARTSLGFQFQTVATVAPLLVTDLGINFTEGNKSIAFINTIHKYFSLCLYAGLFGHRECGGQLSRLSQRHDSSISRYQPAG